jgi:hypothetical protein
MAVYEENEDMITIGAYVKGSSPQVDESIAKRDAVEDFLVQSVEDPAPVADTLRRLGGIAGVEIPPEEIAAAEGRQAAVRLAPASSAPAPAAAAPAGPGQAKAAAPRPPEGGGEAGPAGEGLAALLRARVPPRSGEVEP